MLVVLALILAGAVYIAYTTKTAKEGPTTYAAGDINAPQLAVSETHFDFGKTSMDEVKNRDVILTNNGKNDLQISNLGTSCDCTYAYLEIGTVKSPRFSMHQNALWTGTIKSGEKGILKVFYEPKLMPVKGKVERVVAFSSNDPSQSRVEVHFTAEVD
ncbi:MAG: DUF1573 domain-containing protein [Chloroflexi bacterium]|nr:DUF1573 domain-containing protein [Chloroflexota bacterium]